MKTYVLDFIARKDVDAIHDYIALMLGFPGYYGKNLDALHDCLTEISEPTKIALANLNPSFEYHNMIKEVFLDSANENPNIIMVEPFGLWHDCTNINK